MKKQLTLCIVHQHPQVLLGMKKRGFGEGWYNGFGGKVEVGEGVEEAARREIREEAGLEAETLNHLGVLKFEFSGQADILEVHIFKVLDFKGQPTETEEMRPEWFLIEDIPFSKMWPADRYWLPLFLKGTRFTGQILFDQEKNILKKNIEVVDGN